MKPVGERFLKCIVDAYRNNISRESILNNHQKLTAISNILNLGLCDKSYIKNIEDKMKEESPLKNGLFEFLSYKDPDTGMEKRIESILPDHLIKYINYSFTSNKVFFVNYNVICIRNLYESTLKYLIGVSRIRDVNEMIFSILRCHSKLETLCTNLEFNKLYYMLYNCESKYDKLVKDVSKYINSTSITNNDRIIALSLLAKDI